MDYTHGVCSPAWHRCPWSRTAECGPEPQPEAKHLAQSQGARGQLDTSKRQKLLHLQRRGPRPARGARPRSRTPRPTTCPPPLPRGPHRTAPSLHRAAPAARKRRREHIAPTRRHPLLHLGSHSSPSLPHSEASTPRLPRSGQIRAARGSRLSPRGAHFPRARAHSGRGRRRVGVEAASGLPGRRGEREREG